MWILGYILGYTLSIKKNSRAMNECYMSKLKFFKRFSNHLEISVKIKASITFLCLIILHFRYVIKTIRLPQWSPDLLHSINRLKTFERKSLSNLWFRGYLFFIILRSITTAYVPNFLNFQIHIDKIFFQYAK